MRADRRMPSGVALLRSRLWRTNRLVSPTMDSGVLQQQVERARDDAFGGVLDRHDAEVSRAGGPWPNTSSMLAQAPARSTSRRTERSKLAEGAGRTEVGHAGRRLESAAGGHDRARSGHAVGRERPGVAAQGPAMTCASRSGRKRRRPSRRLSSPTSCARPARQFSSASNSRSTASICVRSISSAGSGVSAMAGRSSPPAQPAWPAPRRTRCSRAPQAEPATRAPSARAPELRIEQRRGVGDELLHEGVLDLGPTCWNFLFTGRFEPGDQLLQFGLAELLLRGRRPASTGRASARARAAGVASSTNFLTSASTDLAAASRLSGATCLQAWPAACISCAAGRSTMLRDGLRSSAAGLQHLLHQLFLRLGLGQRGCGAQRGEHRHQAQGFSSSTAFFGVGLVARGFSIGVVLDDALHADEARCLVQRNQRHALRGAAEARISATRVRTSTPLSVISMISSSGRTSVAATTRPLRSLCWIADHALGAAGVAGVLHDRRALAVAVLGGGEHADRARAVGLPRARRRASRSRSGRPRAPCRTPRALRPIRAHVVLVEAAPPCRRRRTASRRGGRR